MPQDGIIYSYASVKINNELFLRMSLEGLSYKAQVRKVYRLCRVLNRCTLPWLNLRKRPGENIWELRDRGKGKWIDRSSIVLTE